MGSPDFEFLKRARSLDRDFGGDRPPEDVARVQVVSNDWYRGSRERAPYARHWSQMLAPAAGSHAGFLIDGIDLVAPLVNVLVHLMNVGVGPIAVGIADPTALTYTVGPVERAPLAMDNDSEVRPRIFEFNIATAQIPIGGTPNWAGTTTVAFPGNGFGSAASLPMAINFAAGPNNRRALIVVFLTAAAEFNYNVMWQAVRI